MAFENTGQDLHLVRFLALGSVTGSARSAPVQIPLQIGFGPHDCFRGRISDLRLYGRSLDTTEIERLATNG